jgi:hypothetical protein
MTVSESNPDAMGPAKSSQKGAIFYWTGIIANAIFPFAEGVFYVWFYVSEEKAGAQPWLYYATIGSFFATYLAQIVSGVILIWSVYKINRSLNTSDHEVDIKKLTMHSIAFSLFLIGIVAYVIANIGFLVSNFGKFWFKLDSWTEVVVLLFSFVSQCLLCIIFWQLCTV